MSKLIPIDIKELTEVADIMDKCHNIFKTTMASKENRPQIGKREIYVPIKWLEYKAEIFWHTASIESKKSIDILPCNNDIVSRLCENNCITKKDFIIINGKAREKCIYRAVRVNWIALVIKMYNNKDPRIKYWEKIHSNKKNRIYLRYQEEEIDFIVILEEKSDKKVVFITAYPIFFLSAKRDYEKDYQKYWGLKKA